ncbi:MAG: hypothetical protein R3302_04025 [Sulfurimonadaceae bacterium]|nr:hypothetical protein [Sulfurimonadaceae bacterium]
MERSYGIAEAQFVDTYRAYKVFEEFNETKSIGDSAGVEGSG